MKSQYFLPIAIIMIMSIGGCSKSPAISNPAKMQINLVDAPGDYDEVNIDLSDIVVNTQSDETSWKSLDNVNKGIYNLITLTGGNEAVLSNVELPSGYINQIRLILGNNNSLKLKGASETIPLTTPSAQESGLKLNLQTDLLEGITYKFTLDWNADKSIVKSGSSGKYILKPVIRVSAEATSGAIKGTIQPDSIATIIKAFIPSSADTLTTLSNKGAFFIHGVPSGSYSLMFQPDTTSVYKDSIINNVSVNIGSVTDLGTIPLKQK